MKPNYKQWDDSKKKKQTSVFMSSILKLAYCAKKLTCNETFLEEKHITKVNKNIFTRKRNRIGNGKEMLFLQRETFI